MQLCHWCVVFLVEGVGVQGDHFELSQKLKKITFKEKRICQAAIVHIVDVFSPFDNNTPISLNAS